MNRLASAFSSVPGVTSDSSHHPPPRQSPVEATFSSHSDGNRPRQRSVSPHTAIYDDPRQIHYPSGSGSWGKHTLTLPKRPGLLRHVTDEGLSRSSTPRPHSRDRSGGHSRDRPAKDKSVKVNVLVDKSGNKRGWGMSTLPGSGRITAMVQGPDGKYAVGGGQYLRILQIKPPPQGDSTPVPPGSTPEPLARGPGGTISEITNLWRGQWGVSKGVNDLDWGIGSYSTKIISACPSGNILIFDASRGKLEKEFCKSPSNAYMIISGGMEGQAKLWDIRENNISTRKYFKHSGPITSLAFCPDSPHQFLVGLDNGSISRYDSRSHLKATGRIWGAHGNKPVMDLKWKSGDEGSWLASAGADRTVQVWDMSASWDRPPAPVHSLHTAYPLKRVQWRPGHETELAIVPLSHPSSNTSVDPTSSSALQGADAQQFSGDDNAHLEIWDVRRHYIAKYAIASSDGSAIGLEWADNDSIVTAHQNGTFAKTGISQSCAYPLEHIPRNTVAWNVRGEMAYTVDRFKSGEIPFDDLKAEYSSHWDKVGQRQKAISDDPYHPLQAVGLMPPIEVAAEEDHFGYIAERYKLQGSTPEEICLWNGEVAASCGREDDARFWLFLRLFIEEFRLKPSLFDDGIFDPNNNVSLPTPQNMSPRGVTPLRPLASPKPIPLERLDDSIDEVEEASSSSSSSRSSSPSSSASSSETDRLGTAHKSRFMAFAPPDTRRLSETLTAASRHSSIATVTPFSPGGNTTSPQPARATPRTLFAQTLDQVKKKKDSGSSGSIGASDYPDPYGVTAMTPPASRLASSRILSEYPDPYGVSTARSGSSRASPAASKKPSPQIRPDRSMVLPPKDSLGLPNTMSSARDAERDREREAEFDAKAWEGYKRQRAERILQWWHLYINDGEVQMATAIAIVGKSLIEFPEEQLERVAYSYIELLEANRMPGVAAYVRRYAGIPSLEIRASDEGVTHVVHCAKCRKSTGAIDIPMEEGKFWWCKNCKRSAKTCIICHQAVRGLWMSCTRCKHGGHQKCLRLYFHNAAMGTSALASRETILTAKPSKLASSRYSPPHTPTTTSNDSSSGGPSGFDRFRASNETIRDSTIPEEGEEMDWSTGEKWQKGWNVCGTGCGCHCRVVVQPVADEETA